MEGCSWPGRGEALRKRPDGSYDDSLARADTKPSDERTLAEILESVATKARILAESCDRASKALANFKKAYDDLDKLGK